jgi:hypothetical protein
MSKRTVTIALLGVIVLVLALSIPAIALQTNPPTTAEPAWDSPLTRDLAQRACFDCHSNLTVWPPYARIPPVSWLVTFDTLRGRSELNFSEWTSRQSRKAGEIRKQVTSGEMPPRTYTPMHPSAVLSAPEREQLLTGLAASLK